MLGHGDAPDPSDEPSLDDFVIKVEAVVEMFCVNEAPIIGDFSMEGRVTQAYGIDNHERVAGLVILNAVYDRTVREAAVVRTRSKMMAADGVEAAIKAARELWFRPEELAVHGKNRRNLRLDATRKFHC